jgi:very-short-patch-repair endonuclease
MDAGALEHIIGAQLHPDARIGALAAGQHGVAARWQLVELGLGRRAIGHRLACGRLHEVHRGVYAVGHRVLSRDGRWLAAVLAVGPDAVLSHRSAAALWRVRQTSRARVEVTVPRRLRSRPGIEVHRAQLAADEVTVEHSIPVTTVARTLLDLAAVLRARHLERAVNEAEVLQLADATSLTALVDRYPRRRGVPAIRQILAAGVGWVTRSELERDFHAFVAEHQLPHPIFNARVEPVGEVDVVWPEAQLIVELDGRATHGTAAAFERDRERDRTLQANGWRVVRITWRQLRDQPERIACDLAAMLPPAPGRPAC